MVVVSLALTWRRVMVIVVVTDTDDCGAHELQELVSASARPEVATNIAIGCRRCIVNDFR